MFKGDTTNIANTYKYPVYNICTTVLNLTFWILFRHNYVNEWINVLI